MSATISTDTPTVIDGYVRLSRDDHKRNYTSIENQKRIIRQYAAEHGMTVRHIYEDDSVSGYSFDRPDFQKMMADIQSIDVIAAKDLSRIGRHNAKVLLFLEEMEEMGKRIILIDDHYDSFYSDDETIGIKTWDNERHVKDTSRKVRRVKRMEQEQGTLVFKPPFGYTRHPLNKQMVLIDEEAAAILHLEKDLYLDGNGIRKTAEILSARGIPTPSMLEKERYEALGLPYRRAVALQWSYGMVKDTLFNDYHCGVLRTHKRERATINGKDKKVPEEDQFVFPDHHPKIFDDDTMRLLRETKDSRLRSRYRGQQHHVNRFSGCLYCEDCGCKLTAINRPGRPKYYVCSTYNKKGRQFCACSHLVTEETLEEALCQYLTYCRDSLKEVIGHFDLDKMKSGAYTPADGRHRIERELENTKSELKLLTGQKIREIRANPSMRELIEETYASLQTEKLERITALETTLQRLAAEPEAPDGAAHGNAPSDRAAHGNAPFDGRTLGDAPSDGPAHGGASRPHPRTALELLDEVIEKKELSRKDVETLVEKIVVDRDGNVDLYLKYGFGIPAACEWGVSQESPRLTMMLETLRLLEKDSTGFTSVKYLADRLKGMGYPMHKKKFAPYMEFLLDLGLVERTEIYHHPYRITASRQKLRDMEQLLIMLGRPGGMPEMIFEYILKKNGLDPKADLTIDQSIDFGLTAAAFTSNDADYTVEFEPFASTLEKEGGGTVVASLGVDSGYVPYTAYSVKKSYLAAHPDTVQKFTNAIQKGLNYVNTHTAEEIAKVIQPQFKETDVNTIATIVARYKDQDTWKEDTVFSEESFNLLQNILEEAGQLKERAPYADLVNTDFAKKAAK